MCGFGTQFMNTYREIAPQQSESSLEAFSHDGVRHFVAAGHFLRTPILVSRVFALCGFAGAVLVQAACSSLVAHLLLNLDSTMLPGVAPAHSVSRSERSL
jgi:hypothetical protein